MSQQMRTPVAPRDDEQGEIRRLTQALAAPPHRTALLIGSGDEAIAIPESVSAVLRQALAAMSRGFAVSVVPVEQELTTQEAADILNISRQYLVQLLDDGRIPHHKTGTHRRVRFGDLLAFKELRDRQRREGLRQLTRLSEEYGMYDEDFPTALPGE